jgi:hypothetical protein
MRITAIPSVSSVLLAAVLGGCHGADSSDGPPDPGPDAGTPHCSSTHTGFAVAAKAWPVPSATYGGLAYVSVAADGMPHGGWVTVDLDGDGRPDLVSIAGGQAAAWSVYLNTGSAFATSPTMWSIPDPKYRGLAYVSVFADGMPHGGWATVDIDGDGRPDLVTIDGGSATATAWSVYRNTGTGFAASPTSWAIPDPKYRGLFYVSVLADGMPHGGWATVDINGDHRPDLVTMDGGTAAAWSVYLNTGSKFAASATTWPIPNPRYSGLSYFSVLADGMPHGGWATLDLDGDGRSDLVTMDGGISAAWSVYRNTGSGFAASATSWAIPDPKYRGLSYFSVFADGMPHGGWATVDIDGDGRSDLVTIDNTQSAAWSVYLNTGTGFAASTMSWSIPDPKYRGLSYFRYLSNGVPDGGWAMLDLDGDHCLDIVDITANTSSWSLHTAM